jgi:hypothetical protein
MFILTRRLGETILIGDDIRVSLVDIQGSQVPDCVFRAYSATHSTPIRPLIPR